MLASLLPPLNAPFFDDPGNSAIVSGAKGLIDFSVSRRTLILADPDDNNTMFPVT
jgi:hypothetical protein